MFYALVTSRPDYSNVIYVGSFLVQMVQKAAARLVVGSDYCQHITPEAKGLHRLPIHYWAKLKVLVLTDLLDPGYIKASLITYISAQSLRYSRESSLVVLHGLHPPQICSGGWGELLEQN